MESNNICNRCGAHCIEQPDFSLLCEHCGTVHFSEERKRKILEKRRQEAAQRAAQQQAERNRLAAEQRARRAAERAAQWQITKKKIRKAVLISIPCLVLAAVLVVVGGFVWVHIESAPADARRQDFQYVEVGDVVTFGYHSSGEPAHWVVLTVGYNEHQRKLALLVTAEIVYVPGRTINGILASFSSTFRDNMSHYEELALQFSRVDNQIMHRRPHSLNRAYVELYLPNEISRATGYSWVLHGRPGREVMIDAYGTFVRMDRPTDTAMYPVRPAIWLNLSFNSIFR